MPDLLGKKESALASPTASIGSALLALTLVLFFATIASYGGVALLMRQQANAREELMAQVESKQQQFREDDLNKIFQLDDRLTHLRSALAKHTFTANVFVLIETMTLSQVRFTSVNLAAGSRKLDMAGEAISYAAVARQIGAFEQSPLVERVEFGGLGLAADSRRIQFKVSLLLKPSLFQIRP